MGKSVMLSRNFRNGDTQANETKKSRASQCPNLPKFGKIVNVSNAIKVCK